MLFGDLEKKNEETGHELRHGRGGELKPIYV